MGRRKTRSRRTKTRAKKTKTNIGGIKRRKTKRRRH
jgi:hypothetical protein